MWVVLGLPKTGLSREPPVHSSILIFFNILGLAKYYHLWEKTNNFAIILFVVYYQITILFVVFITISDHTIKKYLLIACFPLEEELANSIKSQINRQNLRYLCNEKKHWSLRKPTGDICWPIRRQGNPLKSFLPFFGLVFNWLLILFPKTSTLLATVFAKKLIILSLFSLDICLLQSNMIQLTHSKQLFLTG